MHAYTFGIVLAILSYTKIVLWRLQSYAHIFKSYGPILFEHYVNGAPIQWLYPKSIQTTPCLCSSPNNTGTQPFQTTSPMSMETETQPTIHGAKSWCQHWHLTSIQHWSLVWHWSTIQGTNHSVHSAPELAIREEPLGRGVSLGGCGVHQAMLILCSKCSKAVVPSGLVVLFGHSDLLFSVEHEEATWSNWKWLSWESLQGRVTLPWLDW